MQPFRKIDLDKQLTLVVYRQPVAKRSRKHSLLTITVRCLVDSESRYQSSKFRRE